jgi:glycyl-tRNA synthetase beta chain
MPDFLLEIGCEEIPARMIDAASQELRERIAKILQRESLPAAASPMSFDTPRRLAIVVPGIPAAQADQTEQVLGPSVKISFNDGQPTPAAHSFAKKVGLSLDAMERVNTPKGEYLAANVTRKGRSSAQILAEVLPKEIAAIYWPKTMYWNKPAERFIRPVRWMVALLDSEVIPVGFAGVRAGSESHGHRTLGKPVNVESPRAYQEALRSVAVLASREEREKKIRAALDAATRQVPGARWREDKELLDTVVNLTEWPSVILGNFEPEFLVLPEEVLVTVMRDHQKYFAVENGATHELLPNFLAVLNTDDDKDGIICHGHERVLRARFNDARFFWNTDQKRPLRERVELLKHVTFQKDLGSYYEKTLRVQVVASWISELIKDAGIPIRPGIVHKAALLAKTDLTTELVKEFTELQGIVGGLYARVQQLDPLMSEEVRAGIAIAIYDQYKPESVEDSAPRTLEGAVLSIADKADSIAGMFALGLQPTGSKDPFALRRQANGIVRTISEHKLPISLSELLCTAVEAYRNSQASAKFVSFDRRTVRQELEKILCAPEKAVPGAAPQFPATLGIFFRERLEFYLREVRGFAYDVVNAVLAAGGDHVVDTIARAQAVTNVRQSADFESVSVAFKRMKNILRQAHEAGSEPAEKFHPGALQEPAETNLAELIPITASTVQKLRQEKNYEQALVEISRLRPTVDTFFDKVMVMVDDDRVRANRLALLQTLLKEFSTIADFSEIVTKESSNKEGKS